MSYQVIEMSCPGCGERVTTNQTECPCCRGPIIISSFNSVSSMSMPELNKFAGTYRKALAENPEHQELNASIAMCFLKLGLYDKALPAFEKAMEDNFDNSEVFFYAAVCLLKGRKSFVCTRPEINKMEEYINAALSIEPRGVYYYLLAYIKYDYFSRKFFKTSPTYQEALNMAVQNGCTAFDAEQLFALLKVERPNGF